MIYFGSGFRFLLEEMKKFSSIGFLAVGLVVGLLLGRGGIPGSVQGEGSPQLGSSPSGRTKAGMRDDQEAAGVRMIRSASPDQVGKITRQVLSVSDPVEGQRLLAECLLNMTADNWRDIVSSFSRISTETGRDPADQWRLALYRAGQIAGAESLEGYLKDGLQGNSQHIWHSLQGWSSKDPQAALQWLEKMESEGHAVSNDYYAAVVSGCARENPDDALKLLAGLPPEKRKSCAGHLVWNVVQNSGVDGLDPVLDYASKLDASDPDNARLAGDLFGEATQKLLWRSDHARDVGQASTVVEKLVNYGRNPVDVTAQALEKYRWYPSRSKLDLLADVSERSILPDGDLPGLARLVLRNLGGDEDRAGVREWMKLHPGSPLIPLLETRVGSNP